MLLRGFDIPYGMGTRRAAELAAFDFLFPLRDGDISGVAELDLDLEGEGAVG